MAKEEDPLVIDSDVCIYGGNASGVIAAVQLARKGKRVVIVEFGRHLGGLTSGGLGATDIGNKAAIGGLAKEFYRRLGKHYGQGEIWTFEPHAAEAIFEEMVEEHEIPVYFEQRLIDVRKKGSRITEIICEEGDIFRAKIFVDASYEGDLLALAGVSFHVGREANAVYGETINGVHFGHPHHNFKVPIDPYVIEGDSRSGLLEGISSTPLAPQGSGDSLVQAYNFRSCLTNVQANRNPFPKPAGYDPARYTLLERYLNAGVWDVMSLSTPMPHGKTDTNNFGGFGTDNIGANHTYPCADYSSREAIFQDHVTYQMGLFWFLCNDSRVPRTIREEMTQWGLPVDEFPETHGWSHQLYVREARRMISDFVMTEHQCVGRYPVEDSIGLAAYTMDSHNCQRIVVDGSVKNEGNVETGGVEPYSISFRSLIPRETECSNLLVPVCLSSSHIAYGSIRMEPVFMVLGQSAALAALIALENDSPVQKVDYRALRSLLEQHGQILEWKPSTAS
ncbi:MAG: FAD-dependent oxidoreductase [Chthoniobacteraceae bacterium]